MAYVNTGLPNSGQTQHFQVTYESTLSPAQGLEVARELMNFCDDDYRLLVSWFRGATNMPVPLPVHVDNTTGGATWWGWGPVYNISLGLGETVFNVTPATYARYLLVSEVSEIFMRQRQFVPNYWFSASNEGNKGEALSSFLGSEFLSQVGSLLMPGTASGSFAGANSWLGSSRANFLDRNDANIDPTVDPEISCGLCFLKYLCHQRGIAIGDIIANGSDTFEGVFENLGLGGRSAAFPAFRSAVDSHYVPDPRLSTSPVLDNPFPAPELKDFVATPQVSWVPTGLAPGGRIGLSRKVPMDVLVTLTTDRADLLDLPADRVVRRGSDEIAFSFSVKPQAATFGKANATITIEYAGQSLQRLVQVYSPAAWPMPPLRVVPRVPTDLCAEAFVAGSRLSFAVDNLSVFPGRAGIQVQWQATNATGNGLSDGTFEIPTLPAAGTVVEITALATNRNGVTARGRLDFTVQAPKTGLHREIASLECGLRHIVDTVNRFPRLPIPENKARRKKVLADLVTRAEELSVQAKALAKEAKSVTAGKGGKAL